MEDDADSISITKVLQCMCANDRNSLSDNLLGVLNNDCIELYEPPQVAEE